MSPSRGAHGPLMANIPSRRANSPVSSTAANCPNPSKTERDAKQSRTALEIPTNDTLCGVSALPAVVSAGEAEQQFKDAYYQQTHEHDYAAAAAAYAKVVADTGAPEPLRSEAKARLAQCEEDQISDNLAAGYAARCGTLCSDLAARSACRTDPRENRIIGAPNAAPSPSDIRPTPLPGGLTLPGDFAISPALLRDLQQLKGRRGDHFRRPAGHSARRRCGSSR